MKPFTESARYEYDLTPDDIVLDCGGYEGTFAEGINRHYGSTVHVFEPIVHFYQRTVERLKDRHNVHVHNCGIGGESGPALFKIKGDMTGAWVGEGTEEWVNIRAVDELWKLLSLDGVGLMKLNIEGSEFPVIERMIETGLIEKVWNLQVQWHAVVPEYQARFEALQKKLAETHELTFDAQWVWQNWQRK